MSNTPESKVLRACLKFLEDMGFYVWRNGVGAVQIRPGQFYRFGKPGSSDILGVLPGGKILAVECKADKGRLSDNQKEFLKAVESLGGVVVVAKGTKDVEKILHERGYLKAGLLNFD
ncbi:VRR-NUC domain-containing protein [Treponema primitia]|uniref:VRR-NUC domain-containing protein n=1 Tax=Treponema primitia TaxID=88058 RepID=UPI0002554FCD|nr:VRR-NUC domain-containing protein [Treponema primitia]